MYFDHTNTKYQIVFNRTLLGNIKGKVSFNYILSLALLVHREKIKYSALGFIVNKT